MSKKSQAAVAAVTTLPAKSEPKLPAIAEEDFEQYAGQGLESVTARDILIPRISILQDLSPQLKPNKAEYVPGSKVGMICDVSLKQVYPEGILFLPALYHKNFLEWAPRSSGKGLVNIHQDASILDEARRPEKGAPLLPNGNSIVETANFYGFNLSADGRQAFIPMASTQLRSARDWMTKVTGQRLRRKDGTSFQAPMWYRIYELTTATRNNNDGEWFVWRIEPRQTLVEYCAENSIDFNEIRDAAIKMIKSVNAGQVRGDVSDMVADGAPSDDGAQM